MSETGTLDVVLLMRRPRPGYFSVERVFDALLPHYESGINVRVVHLPASGVGPIALLRNLWFTFRIKADLVHITGETYYCALTVVRPRCLLTILDIVSLHRLQGLRRRGVRLLFYSLPIRRSDLVTAISSSVADELRSEFRDVGEKLKVVYCPIGSEFTAEARPDRVGPEVLKLLMIGTAKHKNIDRVIDAVTGLPVQLHIVGHLDDGQMNQLNRAGVNYRNSVAVESAELVRLYREADVLVFASTYEGFGLPIAEAQALRVPVITSSVCSMPEIAGGAALLVDPLDTSSIRQAVIDVIGSSELRDDLAHRGFANSKRFSAAAIAAQYGALYRSVVSPDVVESE